MNDLKGESQEPSNEGESSENGEGEEEIDFAKCCANAAGAAELEKIHSLEEAETKWRTSANPHVLIGLALAAGVPAKDIAGVAIEVAGDTLVSVPKDDGGLRKAYVIAQAWLRGDKSASLSRAASVADEVGKWSWGGRRHGLHWYDAGQAEIAGRCIARAISLALIAKETPGDRWQVALKAMNTWDTAVHWALGTDPHHKSVIEEEKKIAELIRSRLSPTFLSI